MRGDVEGGRGGETAALDVGERSATSVVDASLDLWYNFRENGSTPQSPESLETESTPENSNFTHLNMFGE